MPANTSPFIQKFLNNTPVSNKSLADTLIEHTGEKNPLLYELPTTIEKVKTADLCQTLQQFEINALANTVDPVKTNELMQKILTLVNELELDMIRPKESGIDSDWIMFTPKLPNPIKPLKMHAILLYRFGFIIDKVITNTNYTVNNIAVVSEHSSQDSTERIVADVFLKCKAKFSLINFLQPHTVQNPAYDPSKGGQQIRYFTDPAHADTTIFVPMLESLLQKQFKEIPVLLMHGMADREGLEYQALIGNCYGRYRRDGWRSFANLLAISFGIEDYFTSPENETANIPSPVVAICSNIPNFVVKGDKTVPMSPTEPRLLNGALRWPGFTINTNVNGHIGYYAQDPLNHLIATGYKMASDRMIHVELTNNIRTNKHPISPTRDKFISVVQRAIKMYKNYDAAIHDPHLLSSRFMERAKNMKLYPELFQQSIIDRYKQKKKEIYDRDTAAYQELWAKSKQLPPPSVSAMVNVTESDMISAPPTSAKKNVMPLIFKNTATDRTPIEEKVTSDVKITVRP